MTSQLYTQCLELTESLKEHDPKSYVESLSLLKSISQFYSKLPQDDPKHASLMEASTSVLVAMHNRLEDLNAQRVIIQEQEALRTEASELAALVTQLASATQPIQSKISALPGLLESAVSQEPDAADWGIPVPQNVPFPPDLFKQTTNVVIDQVQTHKGSFHPYQSYRVCLHCRVEGENRVYAVRRRFNQFKLLKDVLPSEVPQLPKGRHWFLGGGKDEFVAKRKQALRRWMLELCGRADVLGHPAFLEFCLLEGRWQIAEHQE